RRLLRVSLIHRTSPNSFPFPFPTRRSSDLAEDGPFAPGQADAADDRRGDHLEFVPLAVGGVAHRKAGGQEDAGQGGDGAADHVRDRKSTRLNSSHVKISYAGFCLKNKKTY